MKKPKVGDRVTCLIPTAAYYSSHGGNPEITFRPGMTGTVAAIAPKVRITTPEYRTPGMDGKHHFLVVDYPAPETGKTERVGLHFINAVVVD